MLHCDAPLPRHSLPLSQDQTQILEPPAYYCELKSTSFVGRASATIPLHIPFRHEQATDDLWHAHGLRHPLGRDQCHERASVPGCAVACTAAGTPAAPARCFLLRATAPGSMHPSLLPPVGTPACSSCLAESCTGQCRHVLLRSSPHLLRPPDHLKIPNAKSLNPQHQLPME